MFSDTESERARPPARERLAGLETGTAQPAEPAIGTTDAGDFAECGSSSEGGGFPEAGGATDATGLGSVRRRWHLWLARWVPGRVRTASRRARVVGALAVGVLVATSTVVLLVVGGVEAERPPRLPPVTAGSHSARADPSAAASAPRVPEDDEATTTAAGTGASGTRSGLVVSVVGKVRTPGLVTVPEGARVADAVEAAGGADPGADLLRLNMARRLGDGEQIYVGIPVPSGAAVPGSGPATPGDPNGGAQADRVDLNTAGAARLETLPGVGPVIAQAILDWRAEHGPFTAVHQLREVDGIGPARFEKLRDEVAAG